MPRATLTQVDLPDFGLPEAMPQLPPRRHAERVDRLRERAAERSYDAVVVYADREHSASMSYLTGFDPRFEEALLVVGPGDPPAILAGNECRKLAGAAPLPVRTHLYQDLSLPSQPRDRSRPLGEILRSEGVTAGRRVGLVGWNGMPLSCHLMLTSGPRASFGLLSPGDRRIGRGDRFTVAFGIWGALNCRAGFVVGDAGELPPGIGDYLERLVGPYFEAVAEWYGALHIGQTGGVLQEIIDRRLGDPFFGIFLNPGHQLHLDEWVNSPISPGSTIELGSGMAFQVDIIPATGTPWFTTNIEDGIALADESLRGRLAQAYPGAWRRIQARRSFMADALGIDLHPDVLPFSNIPAYLPPFLLRPDRVMAMA